jgi:hypothetical protein
MFDITMMCDVIMCMMYTVMMCNLMRCVMCNKMRCDNGVFCTVGYDMMRCDVVMCDGWDVKIVM